MSERRTIVERLVAGAVDAPAILASGRPTLGHGELRALVRDTAARLNRLGIGRGDRVAIVLPNGPEMATAFLAVAAAATTAPLNPAYREDEFDFLSQRHRGEGAPGRSRRRRPRGCRRQAPRDRDPPPCCPIRAARPAPSRIEGDARGCRGARPRRGRRHRPRPAHLRHHLATQDRAAEPANLAASAAHIGATLGARRRRPLPQHHAAVPHPRPDRRRAFLARRGRQRLLHAGLQRARASSAGSRKRRRPGTRRCRPCTRRSSARAERNADAIAASRLRFIRSSSASLPPQVMRGARGDLRLPGDRVLRHDRGRPPDDLEPAAAAARASRAPSASPPVRRSRSWPRTARSLPPARSARSSSAARTSPPATRTIPRPTATAFAHGWFRTGDQGAIDADGYLRITGRLKEIINRGGEKISPREVDEVLMDHPGGRPGADLRHAARQARRGGRRGGGAARGCRDRRARDPRLRRRRGSPTSRCRGGSSSSTRSRRARPASCSASGSPQSSVSADAPPHLRRRRHRRLPRRKARRGRGDGIVDRRPRRASCGDPRQRPEADRGRRRAFVSRQGDRPAGRTRTPGLCASSR